MAYAPTAWVDGVTPVNAANMNKIETGLDLVDAFVGTGPDLTIPGDMTVQGGDGNTRADTNLYRAAANQLQTDDAFFAKGNLVAYLGGTYQVNIGNVSSLPGMTFGSAQDTNLYRSSAGFLATDGHF